MKISVIIITWKMKELLDVCLTTLYAHTTKIKYEVIVVDNFSCDGTIELIEEKYKDIILVKNDKNYGVASARNQGLRLATGDYILILDADTEFVENTIGKLTEFMDQHREVAVAGPKLLYSNGDVQLSCKRFPSFKALMARRLGSFMKLNKSSDYLDHIMIDFDHSSTIPVDYVIGACQIIRKEAIQEVGLLDDRIFYGPEDIDFCLRCWRLNWSVFYLHSTVLVHHEQRITKRKIFSVITVKHLIGIIYIFLKYRFKLSRLN